MIIARLGLSWLLLVVLLAVTGGCHDDGIFPLTQIDPQPPMLASVLLVPSKATYSVGESVMTSVVIQNATNVGTVSFHLNSNPEVLRYIGSLEGTFMNSDGSNTIFLRAPTPLGDVIMVALSRLSGGPGASGAGVLATFEFLAVGSGDSGLAFTGANAGVRDPQGQSLPAVFNAFPPQVVP